MDKGQLVLRKQAGAALEKHFQANFDAVLAHG
jgi:hypothetical protein